MNELAYLRHCQEAKKAKEIYTTLRELYGNEISKETLLHKARLDKMITIEEVRLLRDFALI